MKSQDNETTPLHTETIDAGIVHTAYTIGYRSSVEPSPALHFEDQFTFRKSVDQSKLLNDDSLRTRAESFRRSVSEVVPTQGVEDAGKRSGLRVLNPESRTRTVWEVVYDVFLIYSLFSTSYFLAFSPPSPALSAFDLFLWIFFICDIAVRLNTGFLDLDGHLVSNRFQIALKYGILGLLLDVLALLPFSLAGRADVEYYLRLVRFRRLPDSCSFVDGSGLGAVLSLVVHHLPELKIGEFRVSYYYLSLMIQQFLRLTMLTYFLSCAFYWISKETSNSHNHDGTHWFEDSGKLPEDTSEAKFLKAFYFILTTLMTIGYGDLLPVSLAERVFVIVLLFIGIANFSMVMGNFISLIADLNSVNSSSDLSTQSSIWLDSLSPLSSPLPPSLKHRITLFFSHYSSLDRLSSLSVPWWLCDSPSALVSPNDQFYSLLPETMKKAILEYLFSDIYGKYRSFLGFPRSEFAYSISHHFAPRVIPASDPLVTEGSDPEEIFLLLVGTLDCEFRCNGRQHAFMSFSQKLIVGDYAALTGTRAKVTFRAARRNDPVKGVAIPKQPFIDLLELDPALKAATLQRAAVFSQAIDSAKRDYIARLRAPVQTMITEEDDCGSRLAVVLTTHRTPSERYQLAVRHSQKRAKQDCFESLQNQVEKFAARMRETRVPLGNRLKGGGGSGGQLLACK